MGATVIDVTARLGRRAAFKRAAKGEPMTPEEFVAYYEAAPPDEQALISAELRRHRASMHDRPTVALTVVDGDG